MPFPRLFGKALTSAFIASIVVSLTPLIANADTALVDNKPPVSSSSVKALPKGDQRYIVQYKDNVNAEAKSEALTQQGIEVKDTFSHSMNASVVIASPKEIESLKASVDVSLIEIDQPVKISGATSIWGLDRIDQRTGRDGQYNIGNEGAGVNAYVVDSGIRSSHVEFSGRITAGWNGINDGRGIEDCNGHGTHVAGTIAGTTYGVAKKANIIPLRVLECDGSGWSSTVIAALDWAAAHHQPGQPAVMNMSIGGFTTASLDTAVRNVVNDGITVVAAAGNSNADSCYSAPASIGPAITVAATDINDYAASFSNYGSCVDIQAPGVSIRSAYNNADTGYNTLSGTSMAAPHVAGVAAVLLSRTPSLSPAQVHQRVIDDSTIGVVIGNKGSTPNRMLFLPPAPVSCANLKLGDAWAGVGLTCKGYGGSAGTTESTQTNTEVANAAAVGSEPAPGAEPVKIDPVPESPAPALIPAAPVVPAPSAPEASVAAPAAPVEAPVVAPVVAPAVAPQDAKGKVQSKVIPQSIKPSKALDTLLTYANVNPVIELAFGPVSAPMTIDGPTIVLTAQDVNTAESSPELAPYKAVSSNENISNAGVWVWAGAVFLFTILLTAGSQIRVRSTKG